MVRAVIFDMDGVLVETEEYYFNRRMAFLKEKNIDPLNKRMEDYIGLDNKSTWYRMTGETSLKKGLYEEYISFRESHPTQFEPLLREDVPSVFEHLTKAGIRIAIASSSARKDIESMLEQCNLYKFIDCYLSGEDCKNTKPHPDIYLKTLRELALTKEECVVVEDSTVGIRAAKEAGLFVFAMAPSVQNMDQSGADLKINSLSEIINHVF
jgi:HAD superfamily hydrolase (TIGR01509 family)